MNIFHSDRSDRLFFADLYEQSLKLNMQIDDQRFEPAKRFKAACLSRGVDPEHIAFNANSHAFDLIKGRAKQSE